jgi:hypothetical protein
VAILNELIKKDYLKVCRPGHHRKKTMKKRREIYIGYKTGLNGKQIKFIMENGGLEVGNLERRLLWKMKTANP